MTSTDPSSDIIAIEEVELTQIQKKSTLRERILQKLNLDESKHEKLLEGKALQIYWYLLTHPQGLAGIREIQKELGFSSPGTVTYQINKLLANDLFPARPNVVAGKAC